MSHNQRSFRNFFRTAVHTASSAPLIPVIAALDFILLSSPVATLRFAPSTFPPSAAEVCCAPVFSLLTPRTPLSEESPGSYALSDSDPPD